MTFLAPDAPADTVLVETYAADALPPVIVLPVATDTVAARGAAAPTPIVPALEAASDTVTVSGFTAAAPSVVVVPVATDTVVASIDFSPVVPGGSASAEAIAVLEAEVAALQKAVAGVDTGLGTLTDSLGGSLADIRDQIVAASNAAVAQAAAASAQALAALQGGISANQAAVTQAQAAASSALAQLGAVATTITSMQSVIGANASSLTVQAAALTTLSESLSGQITAIQTAFDANKASVTQSLASLTTAQSALSTAQTDLASTVAGNAATASQGLTTEVTARQALSDSFTSLSANFNQAYASFSGSISTLTTQQMASAASLSSLSASLGATNATVTQNADAAASATQAVAGNLLAFMSSYNGQASAFSQQIATLQNAQLSTATEVTSLSASVAGAVGGGNDVPNSDFVGLDSSYPFNTPGSYRFDLNDANFVFKLNDTGGNPPSPLYGPNLNVAAVSTNAAAANSVGDFRTPMMPADAGVTYEYSVAVGTGGANAIPQVYIQYWDAAGNNIANGGPVQSTSGQLPLNGDASLLQRVGGFATAPAGTVTRSILMRTVASGGGQNRACFARPFSRTASPGQTQLSPYSPGTQANVPAINAAITNTATAAANNTSSVAASLSTFQATYAQQVASYNQTFTALSNAQGATATSVSSLSTTVGNHTLALQQYGASINGILGQYFLGFSADGQTGGLTLTGALLYGVLYTKLKINGDVEIAGDAKVDGTIVVAGASYGTIGAGTSTFLTQDLTIYVRSDGNDANAGLANTAAGAFMTLQGAWNAVKHRFALGGFKLTFQLGMPGTYAGCTFDATGPSGAIQVVGDINNQAGYIIQPVTAYAGVAPACIRSEVTGVQVTGCTLDLTPAGANGSNASVFGTWAAGTTAQIIVGPNVTLACYSSNAGAVFVYSNYGGVTFTKGDIFLDGGDNGAAVQAAIGADYAGIYAGNSGDHTTITCRNLYWNYGGAFTSQGTVLFLSTSFAVQGGVNGVAYFAGLNGVINTYTGGNPDFIPNNAGGVTYAGGQYV